MKTIAVWEHDGTRAWHRAEIMELLGRDDRLYTLLERAENEYLTLAPALHENQERDAQIKADLEKLFNALSALDDLYSPPGSAMALFEQQAYKYCGVERTGRLSALFFNRKGHGLRRAAEIALGEFKPKRNRPKSPDVTQRFSLVKAIASIAEEAGIPIKGKDRSGNPSDFDTLVGYVFGRCGIENEKNKLQDGDIKKLLKIRANP